MLKNIKNFRDQQLAGKAEDIYLAPHKYKPYN